MARFKTSFDDKAWMRDHHASLSDPMPTSTQSTFAERHYAVAEIAELWNLSPDAVRKLFQDEAGVLMLGGQGTSYKRRYTTLRIPETVLQRVHRRMTKV